MALGLGWIALTSDATLEEQLSFAYLILQLPPRSTRVELSLVRLIPGLSNLFAPVILDI